MVASKQGSKQRRKHTHAHVQCSLTSVGLSQACPSNWCPVASVNFIVGDLIDEMYRYSSTGSSNGSGMHI